MRSYGHLFLRMPPFEQIGLTSIVVAKDEKTLIKAVVPTPRAFEDWCDNGLIEKAREVRDALLKHLRDLNGAKRPEFFNSLGIQIPMISDGMKRVRTDVMKYLTSIDEILDQSARDFHDGLNLRIDDVQHAIEQASKELRHLQRERPAVQELLKAKKAEIQEKKLWLIGPMRDRLFEERSRLQLALELGFAREQFLKGLLQRKRKEVEELQVRLREKKIDD